MGLLWCGVWGVGGGGGGGAGVGGVDCWPVVKWSVLFDYIYNVGHSLEPRLECAGYPPPPEGISGSGSRSRVSGTPHPTTTTIPQPLRGFTVKALYPPPSVSPVLATGPSALHCRPLPLDKHTLSTPPPPTPQGAKPTPDPGRPTPYQPAGSQASWDSLVIRTSLLTNCYTGDDASFHSPLYIIYTTPWPLV